MILEHFRPIFNWDFFSCMIFFHLFLWPLYMWSRIFHAKNSTLYFRKKKRKILASRIMGHFRKKFNIIFFFLQKIFPFVSWNYKNAIYKFQWQNTKIVFWSKFLASGTYGHFRTKFNRVFFFFFLTKDFFICFFDL